MFFVDFLLESLQPVVDSFCGIFGFLFHFFSAFFSTVHAYFISALQAIHRLTGNILGDPMYWDVVWSSVPYCNELTMVVKVETTYGLNKTVQGFVVLEQNGRLFRLVVDGCEVLKSYDVESTVTSVKGDKFYKAFYLPDSVNWQLESKKVKSNNTASIRGRCVYLDWDRNPTGLSFCQVTVLRNNYNSQVAKRAAEEFEQAITLAKKISCRPHY
jgi:hypothetical protein